MLNKTLPEIMNCLFQKDNSVNLERLVQGALWKSLTHSNKNNNIKHLISTRKEFHFSLGIATNKILFASLAKFFFLN